MYRRTEEEVGPRVGILRHGHIVGLVNEPVQAPTRDPLFTFISRNHPISVASYDAHGDTGDLFSWTKDTMDPAKFIDALICLLFDAIFHNNDLFLRSFWLIPFKKSYRTLQSNILTHLFSQ